MTAQMILVAGPAVPARTTTRCKRVYRSLEEIPAAA